MNEPKWVSSARKRVKSTISIRVGSDIHLLEMAIATYEAQREEITYLNRRADELHVQAIQR